MMGGEIMMTVGLVAWALAMALTPASMVVARVVGAIDEPNERKVHRGSVPRLGGLGIWLSTVLAAGVGCVWLAVSDPEVPWADLRLMAVLGMASSAIFLVGMLDDVTGLRAKLKLVILVVVGLGLAWSGLRFDQIAFGYNVLELGTWAWPATVLWLLAISAGINFIDGLDGLAGSLALVAAVSIATVGAICGDLVTALGAVALTGALCGFLFYNVNPARTFMGDGGSMFLGVALAGLVLSVNRQAHNGIGFFVPAACLLVVLLDGLVTMIRRRFVDRRSIFSAERGHVHHRMLDMGLSQTSVVLLLAGVAAVSGISAFLAIDSENPWSTAGWLATLAGSQALFFHSVGSIRLAEVFSAVRRKRAIDREIRLCTTACDELQNRFRRVQDFGQWWHWVCESAEMLGFESVRMAVPSRSGGKEVWRWGLPQEIEGACDRALTARVPIRDRRGDEVLTAEVRVGVGDSLEVAGQRLAAFSRLLNEFSPTALKPRGSGPGRPTAETTVRGEDAPVEDASTVRAETPETVEATRGDGSSRDSAPSGVGRAGTEPVPASGDSPRVAIVHDFLYTYAGAERVLEQIIATYPDADLFSLFDFVPESRRDFLGGRPVKTTFIQRLPLARRFHRHYLPLIPLAIEQLDVSGYDVVLSSSYLAAKGVITGPDQVHICYCHSPARYAWDLQHEYLRQSGLGWSPKAILARAVLHYIRNWDVRSSMGVDLFVANSRFVARRIAKVYRRDSEVVHPPVDLEGFEPWTGPRSGYVTVSRLVPYKRIDLIAEAFSRMPDKRLTIIGEGPEAAKVRAKAGPNVEVLGEQPFSTVRKRLQGARAFVFAAEEDFGIAPVEAMACGTPVIAYGAGGCRETVTPGVSGLFFDRQDVPSMMDAVERFERMDHWDPAQVRASVSRFDTACFQDRLRTLVDEQWSLRRRMVGLGQPASSGGLFTSVSPTVDARPGDEATPAGVGAGGESDGPTKRDTGGPSGAKAGPGSGPGKSVVADVVG